MTAERTPRIGALLVGPKGSNFLVDTADHMPIDTVITYHDVGPSSAPGQVDVGDLARALGREVVEARRPSPDLLGQFDVLFAVGWQFLISPAPSTLVILHDSLLPKYRGFTPTPTALMHGDSQIGVSAIRASERMDAGPILAQSSIAVSYPVKLAAAFDLLRHCYVACADDVVAAWDGDLPRGTPQNEDNATYSIWRDAEDYRIDWTMDSAAVGRFVDAVGHPLAGAYTTANGHVVRVAEADPREDIRFSDRHPGKVWDHGAEWADVVCGVGIVRISGLTYDDGSPAAIQRLRTRLH